MRRIAFLSIFIIILATCCTSRRSQYDAVLAEIDSLTEVDADSARQLLAGLEKEMESAPEGTKAYYHLLQVKATDKARVKHTSDSLICCVAAYFEQHTQSGHLPEAYYYVGRANSDLQNGEKALLYFQKALLEDSVHVTTRLKSRIYAQLGYIYLRNGLFEDAIGMQQLAHFYCEQIGDTLGMRYSNEDIQTITKLSHQVTVSEIPKAELAMKVQKLNAQVKSHLLQEKNKRLQKEKKKERTVVWIAIASSMLIAATFVWRRKKTATSISTNETQAPRTKRQFYDKEIDELLTTHITHNKVLKDADWKKIEERLSAAFPSFKERLFSLYQLSDTEYRICMLIKMEVAPSNIAKLMALGNSAVSQNRLRMQQKVFDGQGTAKDWDKFILSL